MNSFKAISVDDDKKYLNIIETMALEAGIEVRSFTDPLEAASFVENNEIDFAFVDYIMPKMDGIDLIKHIRNYHVDIPVIMLTSYDNDENLILNSIQSGATEFIKKPIDNALFVARVRNLVKLRKAQLTLRDKSKMLQIEVDAATSEIVKREIETLQVLAKAAEYKDPETWNHIMRTAHYSRLTAESAGAGTSTQELIFHSAPLHDVGKMGIADNILLKPGKLTAEEFEKIKMHTTIGYDILNGMSSKYLKAGAVIALTHHEKYNGTGYPNSIKGTDIDMYGRIVAIADVFDALTSRRPYKDPWPINKAVEFLESEKNKHFDGRLVGAFLDKIDDVYEIHRRFRE